MFQVVVSRRAGKALKELPEPYRRRILELLLIFRENPVPANHYDVKKLKGYRNTFRVRIGDFRIIYEVKWKTREICILLVRKREKAYQQ
jgi:mRNA interferase RelE/StbE